MKLLSGRMLSRSWKPIAIVLLSTLVGACGDGGPESDAAEGRGLSVPLPKSILAAQTAVNADVLIDVIVDGNTNDPKHLSGLVRDEQKKVFSSTTVLKLDVGDRSLSLIYYLDDPQFKLVKVIDTSELVVTVAENKTTVADFAAIKMRYIDSDNDGFSNITEIIKRTDPRDPESLPVPEQPAGLTAAGGNAKVTLEWPAVEGATVYTLFWGQADTVDGASSRLDNVTSPYVHTGLTNETKYFYRLMASNKIGDGPLSTVVSATPGGWGRWDNPNSKWDKATWGP